MEPVKHDAQHRAFAEALAAQLKSERALRDLDQSDMAQGATYSLSTYSRIERGGGANLPQLIEIAARFDMPLSELVARTEAECERREAGSVEPQQKPKRGVVARTAKRKGTPASPKITSQSRA